MLGTIVNACAIVAGSLTGLVFKGGIAEKYKETVIHAVALAVVLVGLKAAFASEALLVVILSLVIGALMGEWMDIEGRLQRLGEWLETKVPGGEGSLAKGFVTASLVFCVGSMAIVGALESGLTGNHQTLYAKAILDGIISVIFTTTMGIGVIFSAVAVFIYQGSITLTATVMKQFLTPEVVAQMTSVGGLLILTIGLNMLNVTKIRVGNMLPAIFLPLLWFIARGALPLFSF
ncbi:DUF554 domain-containing protein [Desulfoluna butyratoxydans]|uniref:DUF554 domain-containing protein n=1 Tax=Desulfoluna butyratoxydans TaxID=231438 RepID=A0A4U8YGW7_9BACT|nr:DUF554 domain-containing protein [Desulfoluna butyratoxydans]VFQ42705.1 protein of unknown function duf554 [Desulfoluna butyratoxydans]